MRRVPLLPLAVAVTVTVAVPRARAQPSNAPAQAEKHFRIGLELVQDKAWDSALAEFERSRDLLPTASAIENAAVCLRELGRFDEALDAYDDLRARFGASLDARERRAVDDDVARLERFVGRLEVTSDTPGATVVVDGRTRGTTPLASALRITIGNRSVRVTREGYAPYEERARVASGETTHVDAQLAAVSRLGSLRVAERSGLRCELRVDGVVVGTTPWEGTLSAGAHTALLQCDGDVGSERTALDLATGENKELVVDAAPRAGELRVEPTPADARVAIDGREVSRGSWGGRLPSGDHVVVVSADWHAPETLEVRVSSRTPHVIRPTLRPLPRMFVEASGGPVVVAQLGAVGIPNCAWSCVSSDLSMTGGYAITPHVSVDFGASILNVQQAGQRSVDVTTTKDGVVSSNAYHEAVYALLYVGAFGVRRRFFDRTPLVLRAFAGFAREGTQAEASGEFIDGSGYVLNLSHRSVSAEAWTPIAGPEIRFGYRFDAGFTLDAGVSAYFFHLPATEPQVTPDVQNNGAALPPGPAFSGGLGWFVPFTAALHFEM